MENINETWAVRSGVIDTTRIDAILSQWHEAHRQDFVRSGYTNLLDTFDTQEMKHMHIGAKYARFDVGGSGAWMMDINTGVVYGIKGYGVVDKKKIVGNVNDPTFDGVVLFRDRFRRGRFDNRQKSMLEIAGIKS